MKVFLDIETIPGQSCFDEFLQNELDNFKAPSTLTKGQAAKDLGISDKDAKFTAKDEMIAQWESKFSTEKAPQVAEDNWRKTSFDGGKGEVISIAWAVEDGLIQSASRGIDESERVLLGKFFDAVNESEHGRPPFFIGQYIAGFDLKFLFHRAVILGVNPEFKLPFDGRHNKDYYCTQQAWAGFGGRMSQDNMCKAMGIEGKPHDIDGSKVWDFVKEGKIKEVEEYNRDDVYKNRLMYNRLNFIKGEK